MKLFLCFVIVVLSAYMGRLFSKKVAQRLIFFREYQSAIIYLTDRIVGIHMELAKALDGCENNQIRAFFGECSNILKNNPQLRFATIWEKSFKKHILHYSLTKEDNVVVIDGGGAIETLCKNPSGKQAETYLRRLTVYISEMEIDKRKKCKLYNTSGVLAGLFIALLVI